MQKLFGGFMSTSVYQAFRASQVLFDASSQGCRGSLPAVSGHVCLPFGTTVLWFGANPFRKMEKNNV